MADDPHSFSDPSQGRINRMDLRLRPDFASRTVQVHADYALDRPVEGSLFLDVRDLKIQNVRTGGQDIRWTLDRAEPLLGQRMHLQELRGVQEFSIEVTTSPGAMALQWLEPAQTVGGVHPFLYTQCESAYARSLLPCQDSPSVRFTFQATIEAPAPLTAVMAAASSGEERPGDVRVSRFTMPQPIPSYLLAFAVGRLDFRSLGPRTGIYAEPEILDAAAWEFAENEARLREAENLFGAYLWDRYDLLILPSIFPYGGMENPRLTFLNGAYVAGDRSGVWLIAHELAHAWTGNLVTNATWEDFWLNEGPTTYAESRISEALEGVETSRLRTAGRVQRLMRTLDRLGPDSPMTRLKLPLAGKDPDESYSDVAYYKGMLFFRSLELAVGRERFDAFLKAYLTAFQFRSIASEQFLQYLEERLPDAARAIDARRWIYQPGLPEGGGDVPSSMRDEVVAAAEAYRRGTRPSAERVAGWTRLQKVVFLGCLLPKIPAADCAFFEELLGVRGTRDGELLTRFSELAVGSGYRQALAAYEAYFARVGRLSFQEPVFRALAREDWSRPLARPMLERWRSRHHPATIAALERILTQAGL